MTVQDKEMTWFVGSRGGGGGGRYGGGGYDRGGGGGYGGRDGGYDRPQQRASNSWEYTREAGDTAEIDVAQV